MPDYSNFGIGWHPHFGGDFTTSTNNFPIVQFPNCPTVRCIPEILFLREVDGKGRALIRQAFDLDGTLMPADYGLADRQV